MGPVTKCTKTKEKMAVGQMRPIIVRVLLWEGVQLSHHRDTESTEGDLYRLYQQIDRQSMVKLGMRNRLCKDEKI